MAKPNNSNLMWIWLSVLILLVCVAATAIAFFSRLDQFLPDDEGAIPLISEGSAPTGGSHTQNTQGGGTTAAPTAAPRPTGNGDATAQTTRPPKAPGFEAADGTTVWSTDTQVEIFRVSYENGEQVVTVHSDGGDKVIAPGTESSYTFKLKNTGNVALDYTVEVDAYFTPADIEIPITGRLSRYDSRWIVGGKDEYVKVPVLDAAADTATLGAGRYTYYTLDWRWPYEGGDDRWDTWLGDLAAEEPLTFTLVIRTVATESADPDDDSGLPSPETGDNTDVTLWIVLAVGAFAVMMLLLFISDKEKRRDGAEESRN